MVDTSIPLPALETPRLFIRALHVGDAPDLFKIASDPGVTKFISWDTHASVQESEKFIDMFLAPGTGKDLWYWGLELKETGRMVGTVVLFTDSEQHARGTLGYTLAREHWGRGLVAEACLPVLAFGFAQVGFNRIDAICNLDNAASARVLEKLGMSYEGTLRGLIHSKGSFQDMRMFSILKSEWSGA